MNKVRRKKIKDAISKIEEQLILLDLCLCEEECAFDSLSEGLQQTGRGEEMEECIDLLNDNIDKIRDSLDELKEI